MYSALKSNFSATALDLPFEVYKASPVCSVLVQLHRASVLPCAKQAEIPILSQKRDQIGMIALGISSNVCSRHTQRNTKAPARLNTGFAGFQGTEQRTGVSFVVVRGEQRLGTF